MRNHRGTVWLLIAALLTVVGGLFSATVATGEGRTEPVSMRLENDQAGRPPTGARA
jgi:hypothetical protein